MFEQTKVLVGKIVFTFLVIELYVNLFARIFSINKRHPLIVVQCGIKKRAHIKDPQIYLFQMMKRREQVRFDRDQIAKFNRELFQ